MEIINPVHREFIETTDDFELADRLGLRYCGSCSAYGALSLVMPEAPVTIFHHYAGSAGCLELPVCDSCIGEGVLDLSQDEVDSMESCRSDLCSWYVKEARARKARLSPPLFYAYESYPSVYSSGVDVNNDVGTGEPPHPAGTIWAFESEEQRGAWLADGPTLIPNSHGYVEKFRIRSVVPTDMGQRLYLSDHYNPG
jgi:hypothetical protein